MSNKPTAKTPAQLAGFDADGAVASSFGTAGTSVVSLEPHPAVSRQPHAHVVNRPGFDGGSVYATWLMLVGLASR